MAANAGSSLFGEIYLVDLRKGAGVACAGRGKLEGLNGEGEVLVVGVVHKEPAQK